MKNPNLRAEYNEVKKLMKAWVHPVNLSGKSTFVKDKILVKKSKGRYILEVLDTNVKILGGVCRGKDNDIENWENLMNKMYNLNLKGYDT